MHDAMFRERVRLDRAVLTRIASEIGLDVYVFNRDEGRGVITTADGDGRVPPTEPFPAFEGDEIVVSFELESQIASTCVHLRDGQSNSRLECDL